MKEKNLETALKNFRNAVNEARENPLVLYLDDYEKWIAGNIELGNIGTAIYHAKLLISYYIEENPYTPEQDEIIDKRKETCQSIYQIMDASKKMYRIGQATKELINLLE